MNYFSFVALYSESYGTSIDVKINLTDLGLVQHTDYDVFESFRGRYISSY
jgi:hypothetical protein